MPPAPFPSAFSASLRPFHNLSSSCIVRCPAEPKSHFVWVFPVASSTTGATCTRCNCLVLLRRKWQMQKQMEKPNMTRGNERNVYCTMPKSAGLLQDASFVAAPPYAKTGARVVVAIVEVVGLVNLEAQSLHAICSVNPVFGRVIARVLHLLSGAMQAQSCFALPLSLLASFAVPLTDQYDNSGPTSQ